MHRSKQHLHRSKQHLYSITSSALVAASAPSMNECRAKHEGPPRSGFLRNSIQWFEITRPVWQHGQQF
jgi:hypothetical protein